MLGSTSHGRECPGLGSRSGGNLGWWGCVSPSLMSAPATCLLLLCDLCRQSPAIRLSPGLPRAPCPLLAQGHC